MSKTKKRAAYWGASATVIGVVIYGFASLGRANGGFDPSRLAAVERGTMTRSVVATGKIEPIAKVEIKSKANGIIEALHADVGDHVAPGAVLAELDKEDLRARLREARANLQAAEAQRQAAAAELAKDEIEAEGPEVEFARRAHARARDLFDQQLISQSGLDAAQSALEVAQNRQRAAVSNLSVSRAEVAQAAANVAQAQARLERAEEELANATIRAPIEATVLSRDVEIGSPVSSILNLGASATLVMMLGDIDEVFVRGEVDEADIGGVRQGQPARITVETFRDRTFEGTVAQISPIGVEEDNVTTFEVEVSISNPGNELKANMTANVEIILEEFHDSLIVPEAAIVYDAERRTFVEVPAASEPEGRRRVPVKLGVGNGFTRQVLEGLGEGDQVVLPS